MTILVLGDVHGEWGHLNKLINKQKPGIILQCGDFGFWPYIFPHEGKIKNGDCKIYWCDGNHEDHWSLKALEHNEISPNVFYMKRGSTLKLPDGRIVLFMGGADSSDKEGRILGRDWFPDEIITQSDIENLPDTEVDIVVSHTCPLEFDLEISDRWLRTKLNDPSLQALSYVLHKYRPNLWYFGHFHFYKTRRYKNCRWTCLSMANFTNWWKPIEK